ncbi:MAG: heme lyase CcmF/NrfE family subunit [Magnetococcales bacterium]|nr:heme lyase CcmF/NrfE family subunit [Magnetococcales bacterium]NGZ05372.1 heme lyase CcmF/NrfE family subunit [Magnetococcales bacterium]
MWIEIAHFATLIALLLAIVLLAAPLIGIHWQRLVWIRIGRQSAFAICGLLTLASAGLIISFLQHDFSVRYVAEHASLKLPVFYLATAMWGGHEGSLLFWAWLLSLFVAIAAWKHWNTHPVSMPWVLAILGGLLLGFLLLVLFLSSPFERLIPPPPDGRDLNPLLQDPGMVFHPPFLYMGYVGFAIPYAFAMAALITAQGDSEWILATRRWTLFSWAMLTIGIVFGAYWAYYELGWGGYWAWDPVENASFMPWLTGLAFLHSVMVQERRQMFKTWNLFLIITTFALSLLGTFLVRSGVLSSVHAFATDPGRGVYILVFMAILLLFSFGLLTHKADLLKESPQMDSALSREFSFLVNNLFLVAGACTVLLGTLYPLAVETLSSAKVTVGAPYYNKVFIPIMLGMLALMGLGPIIPWQRSSVTRLRQEFLPALLIGIVVTILAPWFGITHGSGAVATGLIFFVGVTHFGDLIRQARIRMGRESLSASRATWLLVTRNKRRYGGLMVHVGTLIMVAGFVGSGLFQEERDLFMAKGDSMTIGSWSLTLESVDKAAKRNWTADEAVIRAERPGAEPLILRPQKRVYNEHSQPTTEAAIHSSWREDLYVVLGDGVKEGVWAFRIYRTPLVSWIWVGSTIMVLGVFWAMMQGRRIKS